MAWLMGLHIILLLIWSASLIYIPVLCSIDFRDLDRISTRSLRMMTRLVFVVIASPAAVLTIVTGIVLVYVTNASGDWLAAKLTIVALMAAFHGYCGHMLSLLGHEGQRQKRTHYYRVWRIGLPLLLIPAVFWLVLAKPVLLL